jgi:hypothetical protein
MDGLNIKKLQIFLKGENEEDLGSFEVEFSDYEYLSEFGIDVIEMGINGIASKDEIKKNSEEQ